MRKRTILFVLIIALATQAKAQSAPNVQLINPATVATPHGYSHAAVIDLGNCKMVILSGQVALDAKGNLTGANDIGKQTEQVFQNIKSILEAAGGNMSHLVKLVILPPMCHVYKTSAISATGSSIQRPRLPVRWFR